jgi:hypothetical protein
MGGGRREAQLQLRVLCVCGNRARLQDGYTRGVAHIH